MVRMEQLLMLDIFDLWKYCREKDIDLKRQESVISKYLNNSYGIPVRDVYYSDMFYSGLLSYNELDYFFSVEKLSMLKNVVCDGYDISMEISNGFLVFFRT